jgi:uncharacterized protein (TIGR03435 family)
MRYSMLGLFCILAVVTLSAQARREQADAFDVASIRQNVSGEFPAIRRLPGGRLEVVNVRLRDLIESAYGLQRPGTAEGAFPVLDQRFNITALGGKDWETASGQAPFNTALQRLLAERFHLSLHREKRPWDGYTLELARADGRLGPQLRPSTIDCAAMRAKGQLPPPDSEGFSPCVMQGSGDHFRAGDHTMEAFARFLAFRHRIVVEDRTGLSGRFQIDVRYTSPAAIAAGVEPELNSAPELEHALRDQLGLKLQRRRIEIDVLVVDQVEQPTEN